MYVKINIEEQKDIETLMLVINLGLLEAIKNGAISVEQASNYFFSPYSALVLKELGIDDNIVRLIFRCCEIENVERIIPDRLYEAVEEEKQNNLKILKAIPQSEYPPKYWLEREEESQ